jgi:Tetracyclin repressor-like, C-terminal domain
VGQYFQSLPPEQFPAIVALSGAMFAGSDDDRFEFGLDLLVRGLAAYVVKEGEAGRTS